MRLWICYALELKDGFYLLWKSCFLIGVVSTSFWSSIEPVLSEYHAMDEVKGLLVSIECFCLKQDFLHSSTRVWLVIDHGVLLQINRSLGLLCSWCSLYLSKLIPQSSVPQWFQWLSRYSKCLFFFTSGSDSAIKTPTILRGKIPLRFTPKPPPSYHTSCDLCHFLSLYLIQSLWFKKNKL